MKYVVNLLIVTKSLIMPKIVQSSSVERIKKLNHAVLLMKTVLNHDEPAHCLKGIDFCFRALPQKLMTALQVSGCFWEINNRVLNVLYLT